MMANHIEGSLYTWQHIMIDNYNVQTRGICCSKWIIATLCLLFHWTCAALETDDVLDICWWSPNPKYAWRLLCASHTHFENEFPFCHRQYCLHAWKTWYDFHHKTNSLFVTSNADAMCEKLAWCQYRNKLQDPFTIHYKSYWNIIGLECLYVSKDEGVNARLHKNKNVLDIPVMLCSWKTFLGTVVIRHAVAI